MPWLADDVLHAWQPEGVAPAGGEADPIYH